MQKSSLRQIARQLIQPLYSGFFFFFHSSTNQVPKNLSNLSKKKTTKAGSKNVRTKRFLQTQFSQVSLVCSDEVVINTYIYIYKCREREREIDGYFGSTSGGLFYLHIVGFWVTWTLRLPRMLFRVSEAIVCFWGFNFHLSGLVKWQWILADHRTF